MASRALETSKMSPNRTDTGRKTIKNMRKTCEEDLGMRKINFGKRIKIRAQRKISAHMPAIALTIRRILLLLERADATN